MQQHANKQAPTRAEERAETKKTISANLIQTILTQQAKMVQNHKEVMAAQRAAQEAQQDKIMLTFERMISQAIGQKQGLAGRKGLLGRQTSHKKRKKRGRQ